LIPAALAIFAEPGDFVLDVAGEISVSIM